ncbi:MAG: hypothetical protein F6J93_21485 [Oscillatoria sp. SIO1A7]|nr:hypothetical protein [Oscillatoria sp. SIO1A7]
MGIGHGAFIAVSGQRSAVSGQAQSSRVWGEGGVWGEGERTILFNSSHTSHTSHPSHTPGF